MLLLACLILMSCTVCNAQGSDVVVIDGKEFKLLTPAKAREILADQIRLKEARELLANAQQQLKAQAGEIAALKAADALSREQISNQAKQIESLKAINTRQTETIDKAVALCVPKKSKLVRFFEHPAMILTVRIGVPIALAFL